MSSISSIILFIILFIIFNNINEDNIYTISIYLPSLLISISYYIMIYYVMNKTRDLDVWITMRNSFCGSLAFCVLLPLSIIYDQDISFIKYSCNVSNLGIRLFVTHMCISKFYGRNYLFNE